ncbi:MAG TPA: hypothetical protein VIS09_02470 [Streptomyces sp.]
MWFPRFEERGPLATTELEALRSLNAAFQTAQHEWQSAATLWDRLHNASDVAELHETQTAFQFHHEAVLEIARGATAYERHTTLTAWQYSAAAIVHTWASPSCSTSRRRGRPSTTRQFRSCARSQP